jgi:hypothetical protein
LERRLFRWLYVLRVPCGGRPKAAST